MLKTQKSAQMKTQI